MELAEEKRAVEAIYSTLEELVRPHQPVGYDVSIDAGAMRLRAQIIYDSLKALAVPQCFDCKGGCPTPEICRLDDLVNRFLRWPLPESVLPDTCVMDRAYPHRSGTNLLTATEARDMLMFVLAI